MATANPELCLVTGASGYIAGHVIKQLLERGDVRVRGTVRSLKNEEKNEQLRSIVPDAKFPLELVEADLQNSESWTEAVKDCSKVYHVASPFPRGNPRDENELITPAVEGTLNVLKACAEAGTVKRVVLTSSIAAISNGMNGENGRTYTSDDWSTEEKCGAYEKSKLLAEKAAWDFVEKLEEGKKFELAVINPAAVFGPFASPTSVSSTSVSIISDILNNKFAAFPRVSIPSVDVRDVAKAHLVAMDKPEAAGNRFVLFSKSAWMRDVADTIAAEFKPMGYKVSTMNLPKFGLWIFKWFSADAKLMYPLVDIQYSYDTTKLKDVLGIEPIDLNTTIIDTCYSLIEYGVVPKTANYKNPSSTEPVPKDAESASEQSKPTEAKTTQEESPKQTTEEGASKQDEPKPAEEGASKQDEPTEPKPTEESASKQDEPTEPKPAEEGASKQDEPTEPKPAEEGVSKQDELTEPKSTEEETQGTSQDEPTEPKSAEETQETAEEPASKQDEQKEEPTSEE